MVQRLFTCHYNNDDKVSSLSGNKKCIEHKDCIIIESSSKFYGFKFNLSTKSFFISAKNKMLKTEKACSLFGFYSSY